MREPRLEAAVTFIARHAEYGGKSHLVRGCLNEIEERHRLKRGTRPERDRLIRILSGRAEIPRSGRTPDRPVLQMGAS